MLRLQEEIENVVGDAGVDQEQQNDDGGDGATACSSFVVSVLTKPEQSAHCDD